MKITDYILIIMFFSETPVLRAESNYHWTKVEVASYSTSLKVTGKMIPQDGALNIESARVQGRILTILKREGEAVSSGTPLFAINSAECFSLYEERKVALDKHISDLEEGVSRRENQLGLKVQANSCQLIANHSGILTKRNIESGASFNIGDSLVTILDVSRLTAELDLPERDLAKVKKNQAVHFRLASDPTHTYNAKISLIVPMIDSTSRTSKVRLTPVKLNTPTTLDSLIFGEIEVGSQESLLKVPTEALIFNHNRQFVIKGSEANPLAIEVHVVSETDDVSSIRPLKDGELKTGDLVASKGAIFLFKKIGSTL
ncbi:MAG: efflux RND transporter periplasmic adaptor subunit [Bdellovibrionales bacterium]|nr:efflux RND transporter periplasmic adaptor subunit [Bdellovibrionales bacterium]